MWNQFRALYDAQRWLLAGAAIGCSVLPATSHAQKDPTVLPPYQPGEALHNPADPVVATVEGRHLYLSQLGDLFRELPPNQRRIPFATLYQPLLDNLIDHAALELRARRLHLDEDPAVRRRMDAAAGRMLEQALLEQVQERKVTENALQALYDETYGGKPTVDLLHVRLMLLGSENEAVKALARLQAGEDFGTVAREMSRDPSAANGGDLNFLRRDQLRPDIGAIAFSLEPQETTQRPVHIDIGWCIIRVERRMSVPPPSFDAMHDKLRDLLTQRTVKDEVAAARAEALVHEFNLDGSPVGEQRDERPSLR